MKSSVFLGLTISGLTAALIWILWEYVPAASVRYGILAVCAGILLLAGSRAALQRHQIVRFADDICETVDAAIAGRQPEILRPYDDSLTSKVQDLLVQYHDIMREERLQSQRDRQTLQSLISDISHQVKTPVANVKLYAGILKRQDIPEEKRIQFSDSMEAQINKLDFLMQSLIKMSRLETGTFALNPVESRLIDTIAQAMNTVWGKAEQKEIEISVACGSEITVRHDPKWTAEAIGNLLDNAVKYTQAGGRSRSLCARGSSIRASTYQIPASVSQKSTTMMCSSASTGRKRSPRRRASVSACIWQTASSHGRRVISA